MRARARRADAAAVFRARSRPRAGRRRAPIRTAARGTRATGGSRRREAPRRPSPGERASLAAAPLELAQAAEHGEVEARLLRLELRGVLPHEAQQRALHERERRAETAARIDALGIDRDHGPLLKHF